MFCVLTCLLMSQDHHPPAWIPACLPASNLRTSKLHLHATLPLTLYYSTPFPSLTPAVTRPFPAISPSSRYHTNLSLSCVCDSTVCNNSTGYQHSPVRGKQRVIFHQLMVLPVCIIYTRNSDEVMKIH